MIRGLILPHAKRRYSGFISEAGMGATLGEDYDRIIILGANHDSQQNGFYTGYAEFPRFVEPPGGALKLRDHSIEWLAPVINDYLRAPVLSFVIGKNDQEARDVVRRYITPRTLVIASSDLSHHEQAQKARRIDGATLKAILAGKHDPIEACGAEAIRLLMDLIDAPSALVAYGNSGAITEDWSSVVGYAAVRYGELPPKLTLARDTMKTILAGSRIEPQGPKQAVFMTITQAGELQGCTGQIRPQYPLSEAVSRAFQSTLEDSRWKRNSLRNCEIKIALISPLKRIKPDGIRIGPDGIVAEASGGRSALLLPEVPLEHHWDTDRYLREILEKAEIRPSEGYNLFAFTTNCVSLLTD